MQVKAAERRRVQDGLGQDEAIGDDNGYVGAKRCELLLHLGAAQGFWRENRQRGFLRKGVHGGFSGFHATAGGLGGCVYTPATSCPAPTISLRVGTEKSGVPMNTTRRAMDEGLPEPA